VLRQEAASAGMTVVRTGAQVVGLAEAGDRVELSLADGSSTVADVVIGADGIHSTIRGHLVADEPRWTGVTVYRGLVATSTVAWLRRPPRVVVWLGPGQHCVAYPVGRDLVSFVAAVRDEQPPTPAGSWSTPGEVAQLVAGYAGWHPRVRDLLAAAPAVTRWSLHERATAPQWATDRVALAGDAAHPMLPVGAQGANQAVEDAVALAVCLRAAPSVTPARALACYGWVRAQRLDRVRAMVAGHAADHHLADGAAQRERDRRLAGQDLAGQRWLYGYDAELAAVAALATHNGFGQARVDPVEVAS
jgi:salicylate hydroxylase